MKPNFSFEDQYNESHGLVIGVDEVGRGALAGPVVAGAACFRNLGHEKRNEWLGLGVDDSKRLSPTRREKLSMILQKEALWAVGEASVDTINSVGIVAATGMAMKEAVERLVQKIKIQDIFILVDGRPLAVFDEIGFKSQAIVKGDQKSMSIAAASIVAKVYRDSLMASLSREQPGLENYHWEKNKGYGTKIHLEAIEKFGPTAMHRRDFLRPMAAVD